MRDNVSFLVGTGAVRSDLSVNDVRDVLWLASAPELYELLVVRRRWPIKKFAGYVGDMMVGALVVVTRPLRVRRPWRRRCPSAWRTG